MTLCKRLILQIRDSDIMPEADPTRPDLISIFRHSRESGNPLGLHQESKKT